MPDDVIVAINGKEVKSIPNLLTRLDDQQVVGNVQLKVVRDGKQCGINVTLQPGN